MQKVEGVRADSCRRVTAVRQVAEVVVEGHQVLVLPDKLPAVPTALDGQLLGHVPYVTPSAGTGQEENPVDL